MDSDWNERIEAFWRYAYERQMVFERRRAGLPPPWTDDPVLRAHRFTNVYRALDRVSQYLIRDVQYAGSQDPPEVVFRSLLFRIFNQPLTYDRLQMTLREQPSLSNWNITRYNAILTRYAQEGAQIWNNAYMITPPKETYNGGMSKHEGWLRILGQIVEDGICHWIPMATSLSAIYDTLLTYDTVGPFFAMQWTADLNYSSAVNFDENSFVVPGGGAKRGATKLYGLKGARDATAAIYALAASQEMAFALLGLHFPWLGGSRRLHLMDIQNVLCEFDKHTRESHPEWSLPGKWYQTIKQTYDQTSRTVRPLEPLFLPPKWKLGVLTNG